MLKLNHTSFHFASPLTFQKKILSLQKIKKPRPFERGFVLEVIAPGFEPGTVCLEGRCSIQLSYATILAVQI